MRDVRFFASRALQAAGDGLRALFQHARRALVGLHAPAEGVRHLLVAQKEFHLRLRAEGAQGAGLAAEMCIRDSLWKPTPAR